MDAKRSNKSNSNLASTIAKIKKDSQNQQRVNSKSKSKGKNQKSPNILSKGKNYMDENLNSPKTIDCSKGILFYLKKVLQKFKNNFIPDSSLREQKPFLNKKELKTLNNDNMDIQQMIQDNFQDRINRDFNEDLIDKMQITADLCSSDDNIKNDIQKLKFEIETLKEQSTTTKEKVGIFIKLIRKYAKKLSALSQIIRDEQNQIKPQIVDNIISTVNKFYSMIYNPKLNESIFDITSILNNDEINEITITEANSNQCNNISYSEYSKELNSLIEKYEYKLSLLTEENKNLKSQLHNEDFKREISSLKGKLENEENLNKQLSNKINFITQKSKDLESKMKMVEKQNGEYQEQIKTLSDQLKQFDVIKNKNITLENDLKYKDSVISYLEGVLKKNNMVSDFNNANELEEQNEDINFYLRDKDKESIDLEKETNEDVNEGNNSNINNLMSSSRPKQIKKEIDELDEEIIELKNKLKKMLYQK